MTRTTQWVYGWLLVLPAASLLALFTHYPAIATAWHSFYVDAQGRAAGGVRRRRQLPAARRRPDLLAVAHQQSLVRAGHDSRGRRARAADGDLGQRPARRTRLPAARLLHADDPADDRGGQHLALLLHAGIRPARADHQGARLRQPQLARQQELGAGGADGRRGVEGGRLLHDLLPGGAAVDVAEPRRGRGDRGCVALVFLPPRHAFRC